MKCDSRDDRHFDYIDVEYADQFYIFFVTGIVYLMVAAFVFYHSISICRHKKKNLQRYFRTFFSFFIITIVIRGIGFVLYIFNLDRDRDKAVSPSDQRIPFKIINFMMDLPCAFENIATVVFILILRYILKIWDSTRKIRYKFHLKLLISFLIFQLTSLILLFLICAYACVKDQYFHAFYIIIDVCIIYIVIWGANPFISYLKTSWSQVYQSVKRRLWIPFLLALFAIFARVIIAILNVTNVMDSFYENSKKEDQKWGFPIFMVFYTSFVEVFPILCFGYVLFVQKQKILSLNHLALTGDISNTKNEEELLDDDMRDELLDVISTSIPSSPKGERIHKLSISGSRNISGSERAPSLPMIEPGISHTIALLPYRNYSATTEYYPYNPSGDINSSTTLPNKPNEVKHKRTGSDPNERRKKYKY